jgi:hypothetical protein
MSRGRAASQALPWVMPDRMSGDGRQPKRSEVGAKPKIPSSSAAA